MANAAYDNAILLFVNGTIDLTDCGAMLLVGHTPNITGHSTVSDIVADECTRASYVRKTGLVGSVSYNATDDRIEVDFDDPSAWTLESGETISHMAIYSNAGAANDGERELIALIDTITGSVTLPYVTNGSDLTISIAGSGLIHFQRAA